MEYDHAVRSARQPEVVVMKWKVVVVELETGYSWELSNRMKRKRAVKAAKRLAFRDLEYTTLAIPENLQVEVSCAERPKQAVLA